MGEYTVTLELLLRIWLGICEVLNKNSNFRFLGGSLNLGGSLTWLEGNSL